MATLVTCPECDTSLKLAAKPAAGKKVKCPKCEAIFAPGEGEARRVTAERPAAPARPPSRRVEDEEEDDRDREERRQRRQPVKKSGSNALLIGLLVGGGLLVLLVVCGGIAAFALYRGARQVGRNTNVQAQGPQPNAGGPVNPGPMAGGGQNAGGPRNAAGGDDAPPGLYGDQGGEQVAAADPTLPDTLLRARAGDSFYKLSNARVQQGQFGRPTLFVDYEMVKAGQYNGVSLIIHGDDGSRVTVLLFGVLQTHGTLDVSPRGFGMPGQQAFPANFEVYFVRGDPRYGINSPTFKVSNSATVGMMNRLTQARNWTKEEITRLTQPPPNATNPNAHPNVGQDTPFAGDTTGGGSFRYVEPKGMLFGLDYRMAEWEGEKCLAAASPIFNRDQPGSPACTRILAKEGYAVGGAKVRSKRFVDAVQLVFMRVKADGRLDPADSYTSDWFGDTVDRPVKTLAGDGTRVIGIHCRSGAILNGLALVLERPGDAKP
jgi:predicted Zn finger-like uncharacterized protein